MTFLMGLTLGVNYPRHLPANLTEVRESVQGKQGQSGTPMEAHWRRGRGTAWLPLCEIRQQAFLLPGVAVRGQ